MRLALALAAILFASAALAHTAVAAGDPAPHFEFADIQLPASDGSFSNPAPQSPVQGVLSELLMGLGALLLVGVKIGLAYLIKYLREKGESNKVFSALAMGTEVVNTFVAKAEVELKPMFKSFLEDGKIDAAEGAQLKAKLMEILKRDMPAPLMATLGGALGPALDGWLSGKIEQAVEAQKPGSPQ